MGDDELEEWKEMGHEAVYQLKELKQVGREITIAINALRWENTVARLSAAPNKLASVKPFITPGSVVRLSVPAQLRGGKLGDPDRRERGIVRDRDELMAWVVVQWHGDEQELHHPIDGLELV